MVEFGRRFREERLRAGLTQGDVAARMPRWRPETGQSSVSKVELGRLNLTAQTMVLLAHAIGVHPSILTCCDAGAAAVTRPRTAPHPVSKRGAVPAPSHQ
jgi:transcriptional regulator with XRE-family HTH domain